MGIVSHAPDPLAALSETAGQPQRPKRPGLPEMDALCSTDTSERQQAWRRAFREHFDMIYGQTYRMGVAPGDIDDVVQEVFFLAYRKMGVLKNLGNFGGWLRGLAIRVASHHLRYRRLRIALRWKITPLMLGWTENMDDNPETAMQAKIQSERARHVIARMSAKLRAVLVLVEL